MGALNTLSELPMAFKADFNRGRWTDVRNHDDRNRFAWRAASLDHTFDGDVRLCEMPGDLGKHAGLIDDLESQIKLGRSRVLRGWPGGLELRGRSTKRGPDRAPCDIQQIRDHCRRRRRLARASALEEERPRLARICNDGIEGAVDIRKRRTLFDHRGMDALIDTFGTLARYAQELDAIAEFARKRDVFRRYIFDPADRNVSEAWCDAKGKRGEQHEFVRRIPAADIKTRIRFRKSHALSVAEHFAKRPSGRFHLRENEIAGAVKDSANSADPVRDQTFPQRLDDGDAACDRCLEFEGDAATLGRECKLSAVARQQRFVGSNNVFSGFKRGLHQIKRDAVLAADQLHNDIGVRSCERERIVAPGQARKMRRPTLAAVACGNKRDRDFTPGPARVILGAILQNAHDTVAHRAQAGDGDLKRRLHGVGASDVFAFLCLRCLVDEPDVAALPVIPGVAASAAVCR